MSGRNVVLASAGGLAVVTAVYVLTNVSYLTVLTTGQLMTTPAVAFVSSHYTPATFVVLCTTVSSL